PTNVTGMAKRHSFQKTLPRFFTSNRTSRLLTATKTMQVLTKTTQSSTQKKSWEKMTTATRSPQDTCSKLTRLLKYNKLERTSLVHSGCCLAWTQQKLRSSELTGLTLN